ncbi:unnamed protein product [Rotaria sp. Silwood2]|nr:unnamed protein product [Rotaria sp. Silwood2]
MILDESQVSLLTQWVDQLNREQLIAITEQNDIVIMAGGENDYAQQIFINYHDVNAYMEVKTGNRKIIDETEVIKMSDIARILLKYRYVIESSGQLSFNAQPIAPDRNELTWLQSIVHTVQPDPESRENHIKLFDGNNMQLLCIPWEHMAPTDDVRAVATYLFQNGNVRYDVDTGTYAYRYVEPDILLDEKAKSPERIAQHQMLSFHIHHVYVDEKNERIELEFLDKATQRLVIPSRWYGQVFAHNFDRNYIIDALLANGGIIDRGTFIFMGRAYSLQVPYAATVKSHSFSSLNLKTVNLSSKQKNDLICRYIDLVIEQDGVKQDNINDLFLLENANDGCRLFFTPEHSQLLRQNQFRRLDVIDVLVKHGQIKEDESGDWLLYYNNQFIRFPSSMIQSSTTSSQNMNNIIHSPNQQFRHDIQQTSRSIRRTTSAGHFEPQHRTPIVQETQPESPTQYHNTIDYMCRHNLVTWDKRLKVIKLHFADQTLLLPIDHMRSILDPRVMASSSTAKDVLPFNSRQLSQWLLDNSYMAHNIR